MRRLLMILAAALMAAPGAAQADGLAFQGWGPRLGVTMNPDQFHFGAHTDFGSMDSHLRLQPNLELGLGDNLTLLTLNLDGAYRFSSRWESWTPYLGGGVGFVMTGTEDNGLTGNTEQGTGLDVLGGIEKGLTSGSRFFIEGKVGFFDEPDFMVTTGWTFHP